MYVPQPKKIKIKIIKNPMNDLAWPTRLDL